MDNIDIEKLLEKAETEQFELSALELGQIMNYKAEHIKAHIPAWIFNQASYTLYQIHFY